MAFALLLVLSIFAATIPMFAFLGIVWWLDRYDREPLWLVGLTFGWGGLGATLLSLVGNTTAALGIGALFGSAAADTITPVIVAPLIEEPTKAAVLFVVLLSRQFDNTTDGFVYGAATGLGFAMTENFMYFTTVAGAANADPVGGLLAWMSTVAVRTLFCALMHATASSLVGATLGWAKFRGRLVFWSALPVGFAAAMGVHALWNGLITADGYLGTDGLLTGANMVLFPLEFLGAFGLFQICLWDEQRTLRRELAEEATTGLLPAAHVPHLTSWLGRAGTWVPAGVPAGPYVKAAVTLALRKSQQRRSKGPRRAFYDSEVERLRREVSGLLAPRAG